jgi:hypothetical protein
MRVVNQVQQGCTPEKTRSSGWSHPRPRIRELARVAGTAVSAVLVCSPMLLASRPKTPLRVIAIAAFEFLARLRGGTLGRTRRLAMARACDFGSLRNDYYDHQVLDLIEYRSLRCELRRLAPENATSRYIQRLRRAERNRPYLAPGIMDAVIEYRRWVLDLTLQWLQEISDVSIDALKFNALLSVACLTQLADDLLDWKDDQTNTTPSYVTAFLQDRAPVAVARPLRAEADALLQRTVHAAKQDTGAVPFAVAGAVTWLLVVALLRLRLPR